VSDEKPVANLRMLAERVGLAPCSVSAILNRTPASLSIPQHTKSRVFRAASEMNYQPNFSARSLRTKRTNMVAVVSNDFARPVVGQIVVGVEKYLRNRGYLLVVGTIERQSDLTGFALQLQQRGVEGVIAIGVSLPRELTSPSVSIHIGQVEGPGSLSSQALRTVNLGESAAETLLAKIETKTTSRDTRIVSHFPLVSMQPAQQLIPSAEA
jgi:hypothetical protein